LKLQQEEVVLCRMESERIVIREVTRVGPISEVVAVIADMCRNDIIISLL